MDKVIIAIHGLGNKPRADLLEKWWLMAINEGLKKQYCKKLPKFKFEMVYWADILYKNPKDENCTNPDDPLFLKEKYIPETIQPEKESNSVRKKIIDAINHQINKVFLNDDYSLNLTYITDHIIHNYFKDLESYYSNEKDSTQQLLRDKIRNRLQTVLMKYRKQNILLISHSMGTIISYDVMTNLNGNIKINTWFTIGSPLGLPVVVSKIAKELGLQDLEKDKLKTPETVNKHWYNFSDLKDKVAFNYILSDDFIENSKGIKVNDFEVSNNYFSNGEPNPHKSYGYLRTTEVSSCIIEFLLEKRTYLFVQLLNYLKLTFKIKKG